MEALRGRDRTLVVFDENIPPEVDELVPDDEFIDPNRPYEMQLCPPESRSSTHRQMVMGMTVLVTGTVLPFGPLHGFVYRFINMTLSVMVTAVWRLRRWFSRRANFVKDKR
ncbi:MAG: hypothetical protein KF722_17370 [Nitrospira sp.]|nr:hypothetical protein [Nitrospira sp.]